MPQEQLRKKIAVMFKLMTFARILENFNIPFSAASFAIIEGGRPLPLNKTRYTPKEIFGFVDPPPVQPNTHYLVVFVDPLRTLFFIKGKRYYNKAVSQKLKTRREEILKELKENLERIWSPIYRYEKDRTIAIDRNTIIPRPDLDNIPGVQYYTYGF